MQRIDYDEFGKILYDSNPNFQPFGYAFGLYDVQTKLIRFGVRDYDSEIGRWLAKDPISFNNGETNLYTYCSNNPVNITDPNGKMGFWGMTASAAITGAAINVASSYVTNALQGNQMRFNEVLGASISGALYGAGIFWGGQANIVGGASNFIGEAVSQTFSEEEYNVSDMWQEFGKGFALGFIGNQSGFKGVTKGLFTKLEKGLISNVSKDSMWNMMGRRALQYGVLESFMLNTFILNALE